MCRICWKAVHRCADSSFEFWILIKEAGQTHYRFPRRLKQCLFRKWATGSSREHYRSPELSSAGSSVQLRRLITGSFLPGLLSPWCRVHRDRGAVKKPRRLVFSISSVCLKEQAAKRWAGMGLDYFRSIFMAKKLNLPCPRAHETLDAGSHQLNIIMRLEQRRLMGS